MNTTKLERQYKNLTVPERARLMIAARMRDDDVDAKNLIASAERKYCSVRAKDEAEICEAWFSGHMSILILNADQRINELTSALACAIHIADDDLENDDDNLPEQLYELLTVFREQRKATLLAFQDWMDRHEFPIEKEMLEASNVDFSMLDKIDEGEIRDTLYYQTFASVFQEVWNG